jgi:hydroxymethylpyrimidine/phosphomethylpyrimidine kinase
VLELSSDIVAAQLDAVLDDLGAEAVKCGMLGNASLIEVVSDRMAAYQVTNLVVDPVMVSTSGERLLRGDAIGVLKSRLLPLALIVTPNVPEAEVLVGRPLRDDAALRDAARELVAMGAQYALIKGGHLARDQAVDLLYDGSGFAEFCAPRITSNHTHGTGCTFSAAITAYLALGYGVVEAVQAAKEYVTGAIRYGLLLGKGVGPLNHNWQREQR